MTRRRQSSLVPVAILLLIIYYAWFFVPFLRVTFSGTVFNLVFFGCFAAGMVLLFFDRMLQSGGRLAIGMSILIPILAYMLMLLVLLFLDRGNASSHIRVSFTFWGSALVYYVMSYIPEQRKRLVKVLLAMLILNCVTSFIGLMLDERAARALANASTKAEDLERDYALSRRNICSMYLYQSLVVISPILVSFIKKKYARGWAVTVLLFIVAIVLRASFGISFILLLGSLIISWIDIKKTRGKIIVLLAGMLFFLVPWSVVLDLLAGFIPNQEISSKLDAISQFLSGEGTGEGSFERFRLYAVSVQTFLENPLGVGPEYTYDKHAGDIGYHSQILDDLARYGVLAVLFYALFLTQYYKLIRRQWQKIGMESVAFPIILLYTGFLILNIAFRSADESVILLLVLPVLPELIEDHKNGALPKWRFRV